MKKTLLLCTFLISVLAFAQKPIFTNANIKSVTVYANSAELFQTFSVNLPKGNSEVVVKNVADFLNLNTVQVGTLNSVNVLSVQFTQNYLNEFEKETENVEIKKTRDSITILTNQIQQVVNQRQSNAKTIEMLDKNQQASGANTSITVLEFSKLIDFYNTKRTDLSNGINALDIKESKLKEKIGLLNEKLLLNYKEDSRSSRGKLILQVVNNTAGNVNFDLNYLTKGATWKPYYDLRASNTKSPINLTYKAYITQKTGVDWKNVTLKLSSGNPSQNNTAPKLESWFLRMGYKEGFFNYKKSSEVVDAVRGKSAGIALSAEESLSDDSISDYVIINENQLNVSFDISIPYDILSNNKEHSVSLKELNLDAKYKHLTVPRLEKEAFLIAKVYDYAKYNLLPGEGNIIFEEMYVGKTFINPNQTVDTLDLSMGRDSKISVTREKIADHSGTTFLSSYKEQMFTYEIVVKNNKKEVVQIVVNDQYPLTTNEEITVQVIETSKAKINSESGVLSWDLKLEPNETKKLRISYKVRYPKDKVIDNL